MDVSDRYRTFVGTNTATAAWNFRGAVSSSVQIGSVATSIIFLSMIHVAKHRQILRWVAQVRWYVRDNSRTLVI